MKKFGILAALCSTALLTACHHAPVRQFTAPFQVDSYCRHGVAKGPSLLSVISSLSDSTATPLDVTTLQVAKQTEAAGGVIAHWSDLNVLLPTLAKQYGDLDGYIHVRAAAYIDPPDDAQVRNLKLLVYHAGKERWYAFQAFDLQSVCIEGAPKS